jgi:hypothetical protein
MAIDEASAHPSRRSANPLPWVVAWLLAYFGARAALESSTLAAWLRIVVALAPIPIAALALVTIVRGARALDEMQRRIQLEALATAFLLTVLFLMTLGLLQRAVTLEFEDWSYAHVWALLPTLYVLGLIFAKRRYE